MDANLEKLVAMVGGANRNSFDVESISPDVRTQIDNALDSIFMGKSSLIWADGGTLGNAWDAAMIELRDQIFQISGDTPIVQYLRIAVFNLRNRWAAKILQSNERNSFANVSGTEHDNLCEYAKSLIESGMTVINGLIQTQQTTGTVHRQENQRTMVQTRQREYTEHVRKRN